MSSITTRNGKGFPLTTAEMDDNLNNLNNDKQEISQKGEANGYASLDANSKIPVVQIPTQATLDSAVANKVLLTGSFGLGAALATSITNYNSLTTPGTWSMGSGATTNGPASFDTNAVVIFGGNSSYGYQIAFDTKDATNLQMAFRTITASVWQAWGEVIHNRNLMSFVQSIVDEAKMTGLSTANSSAVVSTDKLVIAIGKLQAQINLKGDINSPAFTGVPTSTTPAFNDNTTKVATTAFVNQNAILKTSDTGSAKIPAGTIAQRGASGIGRIRFNTDNGEFEGCKDGVTWTGLQPAGSGSGDVVGVVSSVANEILLFADTGGKQIKRGPVIGGAASSALSSATPLINGTAAVGTSTALARQDHVHPVDTSREPAITGDVVTKFWSGTKTWRDLATDVRASLLTGINTTIATLVTSTDTVLAAIGKLQAQISKGFSKPTSTALTYDGSGRLSTITDTIGGVSKINTLSYNLDGSLNKTITVYGNITRTETMIYTNSKLSSITVLEVIS